MPRTPSKPTTKALTPQKPAQVAIAPSLIVVEGNISAGKTTLCEKLGYEMESTKVFKEPVSTNPYLTKFYAEPKKYALIMQLWLLRQRFETYLEAMRHVAETGESVVLDRSLFSDWVFAEKNRLGKRGVPPYFAAPYRNQYVFGNALPPSCAAVGCHHLRLRSPAVCSHLPPRHRYPRTTL